MKKWKDPQWKYVPARETNIRKTFEREKKRLKEQAESKVQPIRKPHGR